MPAHASHLLGVAKAPAWCFVNVPMVDISSSALRAEGRVADARAEAPEMIRGPAKADCAAHGPAVNSVA
jgi:hypothetical protein